MLFLYHSAIIYLEEKRERRHSTVQQLLLETLWNKETNTSLGGRGRGQVCKTATEKQEEHKKRPGRPAGYQMEDWKKEIVNICRLAVQGRTFAKNLQEFARKLQESRYVVVNDKPMKVVAINKRGVAFLQSKQERTSFKVFELYQEFQKGRVRV
jgi:MinD-like ATPase involved in chromosome partitioning or flagellar assembly